MDKPERKDCTVKVDCLEAKASVIPPVIKTQSVFEYYQNHWWALIIQIALTVVFSWVGFYLTGIIGVVVSCLLGFVSIFISPSWRTKTIKIENETTHT